MLGRETIAPAEQQHVAGLGRGRIERHQVAGGGVPQGLPPPVLGPARRVGRRHLRLGAVQLGIDAAQQAEAVGTRAPTLAWWW